jgi:hypothetical protein
VVKRVDAGLVLVIAAITALVAVGGAIFGW